MARIPDSRIETSDPPIHPRRVPAIVDLRRAVGVIAVVLAVSLLVAGLGRLFASNDDPYLPESRTATGAEAPAIAVPPAR